MSDGCDHDYVFLREEKRNVGYDRNPEWVYADVFFCRRCLAYTRVETRKSVPSRDRFGEEDVWQR